jgi:hypothetical protein
LGLVSQSLFTGVIDAALLSPPETIEAKRAGFRMLINMATARISCLFTSVVTSKAVLENRCYRWIDFSERFCTASSLP